MYINPYLKEIHRVKDHENRDGFLWLDMNENPEGLPDKFIDSVLNKVNAKTISGYPYKEELISLIAKREGLREEEVTLTNGSDEGIKLMYETFVPEGGKVVAVTPSFEMYRIYALMRGAKLDTVAYNENFEVRIDEILEKIDGHTNVVALLNPNSPIGNEYSDDELESIVEKARKCQALVFIDEAYVPFGVASKLDFAKRYDNVIILRTFSKLCSMAGLRVGYMLGNAQLIGYIENAQGTYNVNTMGILFATELLKQPELLTELEKIQREGKEFLSNKLKESNYSFYAEYGNYVLIKPKKCPKEVRDELRSRKILIKTYGNSLLSDWVRVTTGSVEVMEEFWKNFEEVEG